VADSDIIMCMYVVVYHFLYEHKIPSMEGRGHHARRNMPLLSTLAWVLVDTKCVILVVGHPLLLLAFAN
jgi:phosphatidylserine synthase